MRINGSIARLSAVAVAVLAGAAVVVADPAPASAAGNIVYVSGGRLYYDTISGFTSNVVIRLVSGTFTVDDVVTMSTGAGCIHPGPDLTLSTCSAAGVFEVQVDAGDLDDTIDYWTPIASRLYGGSGNDYIIGGSSSDWLEGGTGQDTLDGWVGGDTLIGGPGPDDMYGGPDRDSVSYQDHTLGVIASLDGVVGNDGSAGEGDTIRSDVESLQGGSGSDTLTGNNDANTLYGGRGADTIFGLGGDDGIVGDFGPAPYSADAMYGGTGIDAVDYFSHTVGIAADLDGAIGDDGAPGEGDTLGLDVEWLLGGSGSDALTGNSGPNYIDGRDGNDGLIGAAGDDTLVGRAGADTFSGGPNTDWCDYTAGVDASQIGCELP